MKHKVVPALIAALLLYLQSIGFAGTFVAFGPQSYQRGSGAPVTATNSFTVLNPNTTYTLRINNGGLTDGEFEKVSSSVISLNGVQIVGPNEFNHNVTLIEKPVTVTSANELAVELRGKPGGGITVQIIGVDNDPPTVAAAVKPAPNAAGWHKSDVAVSFTCADAISGVATCPSPVTVNAESTNQLISGTATDQAGNSASVSLTVKLDKTPPVVAISSPANGATLGSSPVTVTGTIIETLSSIANIGCNGVPASLSGSTFTCDVPLVDGANTIVVDAMDVAGNAGASSINVNFVSGPTITITSPTPGTTVNASTVLVRGVVGVPPGTEVGVTVNGFAGLVANGQFTALVPVDSTVTSLTATASVAGLRATDSIPVSVQPLTAEAALVLRASPPGGLAPLTLGFQLSSLVGVSEIALDLEGDGTVDFQGTTLEGQTFTYTQPGIYTPVVRVTDLQGQLHSAVTLVQVSDQAILDAQLQAVWQGLKDALRSGDVAQATTFIHSDTRARYQTQFSRFSATILANIDQYITTIQLVEVGFGGAQYEMLRERNGQTLSFAVWFQMDQDGLWRLRSF